MEVKGLAWNYQTVYSGTSLDKIVLIAAEGFSDLGTSLSSLEQ
jgi:hypothetical protein